MSLNKNQPTSPVCKKHETFDPTCPECFPEEHASIAGVEEQSLGIPEAKADNDNSPPQNTLLPCPFCGHDNIRLKESTFHFLWCSYCGGAMIAAQESQLAPQWNKRAAPSVVEGVEEKLWTVEKYTGCFFALKQGAKVIFTSADKGLLQIFADAHNASLGEPREKEDLGEKDADVNAGHVSKAANTSTG